MRILICCEVVDDRGIGKLKEVLKSLGKFSEPQVTSFDRIEIECVQTEADLVIVVLPKQGTRGSEVIRALRENWAGAIVAIGPIAESKLILRALHEGADLFVDENDLAADLEIALHRLFDKQDASAPPGRLIGVVSASGGCGVSTLAVNLAAAVARQNGKCALLDLNSGRGDLPALLDLRPQFSLGDICRNEKRLDDAMLEKTLIHHASGIHLLAAPPDFVEDRVLTLNGVRQVVSLVRRQYATTIVDLEDCFHTEQIAVIRQVTELLVVCRLNFTSMCNTRRLLDHLRGIDLPRERIKLVANQYGQPQELPADEAERALGEKLTCFIPYDPKTVNAANNTGVPAILKHPSSRVAETIAELAGQSPKSQPRSGLLRRIAL